MQSSTSTDTGVLLILKQILWAFRCLFLVLFCSLSKSQAMAFADAQQFMVPSERSSLDTRVYTSPGTKGSILIRTPYLLLNSYQSLIEFWLDHGFDVVLQSAAGTGNSLGDFKYLSTTEIEESKAVLSWMDDQSFLNKPIVLFGESYDGFLALAAALTSHQSVKAVVAASAPSDIFTDSFTSGGLPEYYLLRYYINLSRDERMPNSTFERMVGELYEQNVPFTQMDNAFFVGGFEDWDKLVREASELRFRERGTIDQLSDIPVPVLFMAGELSDQDATDALHGFQARRQKLNGFSSPCATKLAIGPWPHGTQTILSRTYALNFIEDAIDETLTCQYQHQIDWVSDLSAKKIKRGQTLSDLFDMFSIEQTAKDVSFGFSYKPGPLYQESFLRLP